jgi:predicted phage terminase large subunit-like protein
MVTLWDTIIPDDFIYGWHIEYLCNEMQKVGQWVIDRVPAKYDLIINVPPGSTKSTICSIFFHVWLWINDPSIRMITASHNEGLATDHAVKSRDVLKSGKFQELFPNKVIFKGDQDNKTFYENLRKGSRSVASPGKSPVGKHAHILSWDDLIDPEKVLSPDIRDKVNKWAGRSLSSRKINKKNTPTVGIMQRLEQEDPTGYAIEKAKKKGKKIKLICLPATDELDNIRPKKLKLLYKNGLLDPVRLDREVLNDAKIDLGDDQFAGQMNQSPVKAGGNIIKKEWIQPFTELPRGKPISVYQSWDTAYKKNENNAYQCCTTWYEYSHGYYLEHAFWERMEYPELKVKVESLESRFAPDGVIIEDKSSGTPVMQELKRGTRINFIEIEPEGDKEARAHASSPTFNSKNVYIRTNAEWSDELIEQITLFPKCKIKDIMDSVSQYINYIRANATVSLSKMRGGRRSSATKGYR